MPDPLESAPVRSAWLRFPELRLEPLEQTYTRDAEQCFRYRALIDGESFIACLDTDVLGRESLARNSREQGRQTACERMV
jgi:hypothetical protein